VVDLKEGEVRGSQVLGASVNYSPEFTAPEPNLHLLRRIADSGGGKILDPSVPALNPFLHDRQKTFQPHDLWEWLLKFAVVLFTLDVGVRRIQIDRDEWLRATQTLRRWLFFLRPAPRPVEAEESLAALLAKREQVRSRQTAPAATPAADLFRPERMPAQPLPGAMEEQQKAPVEQSVTSRGPEQEPAAPTNTTSRLLEAKKRAQRRRE
jgi:hypothetical protein